MIKMIAQKPNYKLLSITAYANGTKCSLWNRNFVRMLPCRSNTTRFHNRSHARNETNKAKMNTKCNEEVGIKFAVFLYLLFLFDFHFLETERKDPN
jgi:hypothetical protein